MCHHRALGAFPVSQQRATGFVPLLCPDLRWRSGDGGDGDENLCATNKNKQAFRVDEKEGEKESMFVTLLIIFILCRLVYCVGGRGDRMSGYKVVVGVWRGVSAVVCVQWRSTAALCSSSVAGCPGGLKAVWKPGGGEWNWLAGLAVGGGR